MFDKVKRRSRQNSYNSTEDLFSNSNLSISSDSSDSETNGNDKAEIIENTEKWIEDVNFNMIENEINEEYSDNSISREKDNNAIDECNDMNKIEVYSNIKKLNISKSKYDPNDYRMDDYSDISFKSNRTQSFTGDINETFITKENAIKQNKLRRRTKVFIADDMTKYDSIFNDKSLEDIQPIESTEDDFNVSLRNSTNNDSIFSDKSLEDIQPIEVNFKVPGNNFIKRRSMPKYWDFISSLMNKIDLSNKLRDPKAEKYRSNFRHYKDKMVKRIFQIINTRVFDEVLPEDLSIVWNPKLLTTSGICICQKSKTRGYFVEKIELSNKVCTDSERVLTTLIHEICHAVDWLLYHSSSPHGPTWKSCALLAHESYPCVPLSSSCHNFQIHYKYQYWCLKCNKMVYGRHSRSLKLNEVDCDRCFGSLKLYLDTHGNGELKASRTLSTVSPFAKFVKENYARIRKCQSHGDTMQELAMSFKSLDLSNAKE